MGGRDTHLGDHGRLGCSAAESKVAVGARTRSALLLASALGCSLAVFATPAAALPTPGACGPITVNGSAGSVTCTATSGTGNTYPNGITYTATQPVDLTVVLQGGTTGAVTVNNTTGTGVRVTGYAGNAATVKTYAGASVTGAQDGIDVFALGSGSASINNAGTVKAVYQGLYANSDTGNVSITNSGAVTVGTGATGWVGGVVAGYDAGGTATLTNSAAVTVNTAGYTTVGLYTSAQGAQTINNNAGGVISVTSSGAGATVAGIWANGTASSPVTINNADAVTVNATGATATAYGIRADNAQSVAIDLTGASAVSATGYTAFGVHATASGAVSVTGAAGTTITANATGDTGMSAGVYARSTGGTTTVNVASVSATGYGTMGVNADGYNGVTVDVGAIVKGVAAGVTTTGDWSAGVNAFSYAGSATVTNHGLVQTSGAHAYGVSVYADQGDATVVNATGATIHTKGDNAAGVYAGSGFGNVVVTNNGAIITEGKNADGVYAWGGNGSGTVTVTNAGTITTSGDNANGVYGGSRLGSVVVNNTDAITTSGANANGVFAWGGSSSGSATVVNTGTIITTGDYSDGVKATASGNVGVTAGTITTGGVNSNGVYARSYSGAVTIGSTKVTTSGVGAIGLSAVGKYGATVTTGAVTTKGANATGVVASSVGKYSQSEPVATVVHVTGPIVTSGDNADGVQAYSSFGTVQVDGTGSVTVSGAGSTGIKAIANKYSGTAAPAVSVTVGGAVSSAKGQGVYAYARDGVASVTVASTGSVSGATGGVSVNGWNGASLTNSGSVSSTSGFAANVVSGNGTATLVNAVGGKITGAVNVSGYTGATFTNAGVWNVTGTSTFYAYSGGPQLNAQAVVANNIVSCGVSLCNTGTVNVAAGTSTPTTVTITGATSFNNAGLINMQNGHAGDVFNLGGAAFVGATGSQLAVEVDGTPTGVTADKLIVGAASGTTSILVKDLGGFNLSGATVAQAANGSPSGAFVLGTTRNGFVDYALGFDASATTWNLYGLPSHAAFETLKLPQLSQAFAERSDDVWYQRMQEVRDATAAGSRKDGWEFWGQVYGGEQTLSQARTFSLSNVSFNEDLSTKSAWGGVQFGVDHVSSWRSGRLLYGFTAGYLEQWSQFNTGSTATYSLGQLTETGRPKDTLQVKGANFGAYWGYTQGGWFLNGLAKVDFGGVDVKLNSIQLAASTNATVWGVNGEFGYRFGDANLFVEPVLRLQGGDTNVDKFGGENATVAYPDETNLLATAGARVGGKAAVGSVTLSPWFGAYVADELLGANRSSIALGGTTLNLEDQATRSFARFDLGVTANAPFGAQGFVKAGADTGSGVSGWTVNFGARWRF